MVNTSEVTNGHTAGSWEETNLQALQKFKPELYHQVVQHNPQTIGQLVQAQSGDMTLVLFRSEGEKILAYNTSDPWQDAAQHLQTVEPITRSLVIFIGMGLGYGPLLVQGKS